MSLRRLLATAVLACFASGAAAQYIWVDENGRKQLSDRPPPPSVPAKNILKQPGAAPMRTPEQAAADAERAAAAEADKAAKAEAAANPPAPTLDEREADYRKRMAEKAERDKKAAETARQQDQVRRQCDSARQAMAQLNSGRRLRMPEANGERAVMTDEVRAQETQRAQKTLAQCK